MGEKETKQDGSNTGTTKTPLGSNKGSGGQSNSNPKPVPAKPKSGK